MNKVEEVLDELGFRQLNEDTYVWTDSFANIQLKHDWLGTPTEWSLDRYVRDDSEAPIFEDFETFADFLEYWDPAFELESLEGVDVKEL